MSNNRYIEIDSTYRNRNQWPNPAEFEMLISQSGRKDKFSSVDPVSNSARLANWISNNFDSGVASRTITVTVDTATVADPLPGTSSQQNFIVTAANPPSLQEIENYYINAIADNTTISEQRRITEYTYLGLDSSGDGRALISIDSPYGSTFAPGDTIIISDPTDISDPNNPQIFVPNGRISNNAYPGCLLYNVTRSLATGIPEYRIINGYNSVTHLLSLEANGPATATSGSIAAWNVTDELAIRKEPPQIGTLNNNISSNNVFSLPTSFNSEYDAFRNSFIQITSGPSTGDIRLINRYETFSGNAINGTLTTIIFPAGASNISGFYNNSYVQITSGASAGDVRQVTDYTITGSGSNLVRTATVDSPFTAAIAPTDSFTFRSGFVSEAFSSGVNNGDNFEFLHFSYDNMNGFVYTGSLVSQQEMVCYEIELLNLILPNITLNTGVGSRIVFYPYVYVEISNISGASAGNKNIIYSNNPNSTKMTFRVPIDDTPSPLISTFIKVDSDGSVQTIKFKPNDNLRFSVRLPNGDLFQTLETDNFGPLHPNPIVQISAMFSIRRI